jgi:hypothetical protein
MPTLGKRTKPRARYRARRSASDAGADESGRGQRMAMTDLTLNTDTTDDVDLTVRVVKDRATDRVAIGLSPDAAALLGDLLDAMDTSAHELAYSYGLDRGTAEQVATVLAYIKAGLSANAL